MKKIAAFVMTACLLLCLSLQLPAPPPLEYTINISIEGAGAARMIELGEKYAYAVPPGIPVKWTCASEFVLQFEGESPFDENLAKPEIIGTVWTFEKRIRAEAKINHVYKYTIFVVDRANQNKPLTLDPVIIIKPPRN